MINNDNVMQATATLNGETSAMTFSAPEDAEFSLVEDGEYEVVLEADKNLTKNGFEILNLKFRIRKDVEQKFQNRIIFETLFKDKNNSKWFDLKKLNKIIWTQPNPKTNYSDVDECIQYINGKCMRITVEQYDDVNNITGDTKKRNRVKFLSYAPSQANNSIATNTNNTTVDLNKIDIPDEDLPF